MSIPDHILNRETPISHSWSADIGDWLLLDVQVYGEVENSEEWRKRFDSDRTHTTALLGVVVASGNTAGTPKHEPPVVGQVIMVFCSSTDLNSWVQAYNPQPGQRWFLKRVADRRSQNGRPMHSYLTYLDTEEVGQVVKSLADPDQLKALAPAGPEHDIDPASGEVLDTPPGPMPFWQIVASLCGGYQGAQREAFNMLAGALLNQAEGLGIPLVGQSVAEKLNSLDSAPDAAVLVKRCRTAYARALGRALSAEERMGLLEALAAPPPAAPITPSEVINLDHLDEDWKLPAAAPALEHQ